MIWKTQRHLARQARRCKGGFLVGHASRVSTGRAVEARISLIRLREIAINSGTIFGSRGTQAPGMTRSPPTGNLVEQTPCGSCGPRPQSSIMFAAS